MIQPKISVVTVCYNAVRDIEKTILSVINQTYPNIEYIIIDGGSKDGTMDIVNRYKDKIDVIVSEPDKGIYDAMNKGIDRATGEWINFMNAGDCFVDDYVVEKLYKEEYHEKVTVIFGNQRTLQGNRWVSVHPKPFYEITGMKVFHGKGICHQCMFLRYSVVKENPFSLRYPICDDFYQVFNIHKKYPGTFCYKDIDVANFDSEGYSCTHKEQAYYENFCIIHGDKTYNKMFLVKVFSIMRCVKRLFKKVI